MTEETSEPNRIRAVQAVVERIEPLKPWIDRAMPWLSLGTGIGGALLMERRPEQAAWVATAALAGWAVLAGVAVLRAWPPERLPPWFRAWVSSVRYSAGMAAQALMQLCLFFALPFFVRAATPSLGHGLFVLLLLAASAVLVWDPIYYRALEIPGVPATLQTFVAFVSLACVLPVMGYSNQSSLYASASATVLGLPLLAWAARPTDWTVRKAGFRVVTTSVGSAALLWFGASWVPPAPLRLTSAGIGTRIEGRELVDPRDELVGRPDRLVCATAVAAPRGLRDRLFHIWRKDGKVLDVIELGVRGGREAGFRTWSMKQALGSEPYGWWSCTVQTQAGQQLGVRWLELKPAAAEAD